MTFRLLRPDYRAGVAGPAPVNQGLPPSVDRPSGATASLGSEVADDAWARASAHGAVGAVRGPEHRFAAEALAELEAVADGTMRVLVLAAGPTLLATWISDRGHAVTVLDPAGPVLGQQARDSSAEGTAWSCPPRVVARYERLPFADETFDVVAWVPALEGIPPGNDRVVLWDIGRVLKAGGRLIWTLGIGSRGGLASDEPNGMRTVKQATALLGVNRLLTSISQTFVVSPADLPPELEQVTWGPIEMTPPERASSHLLSQGLAAPVVAERPTLGAVLERRADAVRPPAAAVEMAYLEGQAALDARVGHARSVVTRAARLVDQLQAHIVDLATEIASIQVHRDEIASIAEERLSIIREQRNALENLRANHANALENLRAKIENVQGQLDFERNQRELRELEVKRILNDIEDARRAVGGENDTYIATRIEVFEEQEQALEAYLRVSLEDGFWKWVAPQLGVLYQHDPMPLQVPEHYLRVVRLPSSPVISIVTPTLNGAQFLSSTLDSVLDQEYPTLEYIVQDGGSTDETPAIVEEYKSRLAHFNSERDSGMAQAINRGFSHASGEIMAYLNGDDLLLPGSLNFVAAYFVAHPDVDVVYGHRVLINAHDAEIGRWVLPPHDDAILSWADYIPQETLFWRRRIWERAGGAMDESFRFALDWDLILRFRDAGATFVRLPRFLGAFRIHADQKTSTQLGDVGAGEMDRIRERLVGRPVSHAEVWRYVEPYMRRHKLYHKLYRLGALPY